MPITNEIRSFLRESGYTNYCFVSYAYTGENQMTEFARRIQQEIENELGNQVPNPRVFLNTKHIQAGDFWPQELRDNLAGSLTMVAVLSQIYFTEEHFWCGIEWTAMDKLGAARLPHNNVQPIIPVLFRKPVLPPGVELRQYLDLSKIQTSGASYYRSQVFREAISKIVEKIETMADVVYKQRCTARVNNFAWPTGPTYAVADQPPPGRSSKKKKAAGKNGKGS